MSICIINMNTTTLHEYFFQQLLHDGTKCGSHSGAGPTFARNVRGFRAHGHPEQLGASVLSHKNKQGPLLACFRRRVSLLRVVTGECDDFLGRLQP